MSSSKDDKANEIPDKLFDASSKKVYKRLRFFGKVKFNYMFFIYKYLFNNISLYSFNYL